VPIMGLPPRFWARVAIQDAGYETACLIWTGSRTKAGYGNLNLAGKYVLAHRVAFTARYGEIPKRLDGDRAVLDHLCRNRACVNVDHLELVTNRINIIRSAKFQAIAARTHCEKGHEFTPENTGRSKRGGRECIACRREQWRLKHPKPDAPRPNKPREPKTHCKRGHEFTQENTYTPPSGKRECRVCRREQVREHRKRNQ
jgi:HNH endonuclease